TLRSPARVRRPPPIRSDVGQQRSSRISTPGWKSGREGQWFCGKEWERNMVSSAEKAFEVEFVVNRRSTGLLFRRRPSPGEKWRAGQVSFTKPVGGFPPGWFFPLPIRGARQIW